jgi:hypothetical protein
MPDHLEASTVPMTADGVARFVGAWYLALDQHAPLEECLKLLAEKDLRMQFPDGDIRDHQSFETKIDGDTAVVDVVVGWQASWWEPPSAKSKRVSMDATQRWTVRASARNAHGMEIVAYNATVKPFNYAPGFARL